MVWRTIHKLRAAVHTALETRTAAKHGYAAPRKKNRGPRRDCGFFPRRTEEILVWFFFYRKLLTNTRCSHAFLLFISTKSIAQCFIIPNLAVVRELNGDLPSNSCKMTILIAKLPKPDSGRGSFTRPRRGPFPAVKQISGARWKDYRGAGLYTARTVDARWTILFTKVRFLFHPNLKCPTAAIRTKDCFAMAWPILAKYFDKCIVTRNFVNDLRPVSYVFHFLFLRRPSRRSDRTGSPHKTPASLDR